MKSNKKSILYTLVIIVMKECYRLPDHSEFFFHSNGGGKQKVGHKRLELSYAEKRYKMAK